MLGGCIGGKEMMVEFLAGIAVLAFVGSVCYTFYMIAEEQRGEWKE